MAKAFASVLIDTYNHERFIEQAIVSVLEQDFPSSEREIIVVDDGSTDRTPEIVKKFEPQVRLLRKENGGQASAFNAGIPECQGEIIAFLDGDDWWALNKLSRVSAVMMQEPCLGMVGHAIIESRNDHSQRVIALGQPERLRCSDVQSANVFRLRRAYLGTSRMVLRAALARKTLPVPEALLFEADEYLFTLAALEDFMILSDPLTYYRIHGGNLFLAPGGNMGGERRKQRVLAALVKGLEDGLTSQGVPAEVKDCILELVRAEEAQLRLKLDGGRPWETFCAESTVYRVLHADASWKHKMFRALSMIPALLLPPRWYYAGRHWLTSQSWYVRLREQSVPVPEITKIHSPGQTRNDVVTRFTGGSNRS